MHDLRIAVAQMTSRVGETPANLAAIERPVRRSATAVSTSSAGPSCRSPAATPAATTPPSPSRSTGPARANWPISAAPPDSPARFDIEICCDSRGPEVSTELAERGAEILFLPHASGGAETPAQKG